MATALLMLVAVTGTNGKLFAQDFIPNSFVNYYFSPKNLGFATPQTAELAKYTQANVNCYNGLLDLEIPVLHYKDNSFDIPITLKYISDGFKPGRRPSVVGNNWMLNVGGVITRNVNGKMDDGTNAILSKIREGKLQNFTKDQLYKLSVVDDLKGDNAPDIFHFSFGGYKGFFLIGNDGQIISSLGDGFLIDVSGISIQDYSTTDLQKKDSKIKITTPDGFVYEFGGDINCIEYNIPNNIPELEKTYVQITAWYLKTIQDLNNDRIAQFSYTSRAQKDKYKLFLDYSDKNYKYGTQIMGGIGYTKCYLIESQIHTPVLENIRIDNATIDLHYFDTYFYEETDISDITYLSSIRLSYDNDTKKSASFNYVQNGKYFFVSQMEIQNGDNPEKYSFEYDLSMPLPDPLTISVDHWGFWNGRYDIDEDTETYLNNINIRKAVNTNVCSISMLSSVTYPTTGRMDITYEHNRYNYWKIQNDADNPLWYWNIAYSSVEKPCGGVRVKSLSNYDPISEQEITRTFEYINPEKEQGSGVIGLLASYTMPTEDFRYQSTGQENYMWIRKTWSRSSNTVGRLHNVAEYHIGYSDVSEIYNNGSRIHYRFSSSLDMPDDDNIKFRIELLPATGFFKGRSFTFCQILQKDGLYNPNDLSSFRGKLLSKITYNSDQRAVSTDSFVYNTYEAENDYEVSISRAPSCIVSNRIFTTPCRLIKETHTDDDNVVVTKEYTYNAKNLIAEKRITRSDGDTLALSYYYPFNSSNVVGGINYLSTLNQLNKIDDPVLLVKTKKQSGSAMKKTLSSIKYDYGSFGGKIRKSKLYEWGTNAPNKSDAAILNGTFNLKEEYLNYDNYGNIVHLIENGRDKTVYLWSYHGQYPVAEIKGADYDEVKTALGCTPESLSAQTQPNMTLIDGLRNKLPAASITTYTHSPLVGVTSSTSPRGVTTYYEYDADGRLVATYIQQGNEKLYLQRNIYNYSTKTYY